MLKAKKIYKHWQECEYDREAKDNEYNRLKNAMWALYENNIINLEQLKKEIEELNKILDLY